MDHSGLETDEKWSIFKYFSAPQPRKNMKTVQKVEEKGAWGALKDATLDAVDLIQDAGAP